MTYMFDIACGLQTWYVVWLRHWHSIWHSIWDISNILSDIYSKIVSDILPGRGGAQRASDPVGPREMARSLYKVAVHRRLANKKTGWQCWLGSWQVREWVWCMLCCVVWFVCVQEVPLKSRDCHAANGENPASSSGWTPVVFPPKPNWWSGKHPDMISGNQTYQTWQQKINGNPCLMMCIYIYTIYLYYIYILWESNMAMEHLYKRSF